MPNASTKLADIYRACLDRFGHQGWWPGETQLEICVGAILTQNTAWRNVERAIANLNEAGAMSLAALDDLPRSELADLIRPAGYFNVKTRRLQAFVAHVREGWGDNLGGFLDRPIEVLRPELLGIHGIGPETADSILLYAAGKPTFVVDAYTSRIFYRHHLIGPGEGYDTVKALCEDALPTDAELYNDFHAQLVAVGKDFCKPRARCEHCPLESFPHDATRED